MDKRRILVFGDSNTWGWNPSNTLKPPIVRWSDEERFTGVMQKELGDGYTVITEGLNGRTTVWDDPIEEYRCGKAVLIPLLDSHAPLDLVIIMLGTNDLKRRFSVTPRDIAEGAGQLAAKTLCQVYDFRDQKPEVLLICPPRLGDVGRTHFGPVFGGNEDKSTRLAPFYKEMADMYGVHFLNADEIVKSSKTDGLHWDADQHEKMGKVLAVEIEKIFDRAG